VVKGEGRKDKRIMTVSRNKRDKSQAIEEPVIFVIDRYLAIMPMLAFWLNVRYLVNLPMLAFIPNACRSAFGSAHRLDSITLPANWRTGMTEPARR